MANVDLDEDRQDDDEGGGASWLTTWADMMSVLLTFFIVLQAFSTVSERKFDEAVESIRRAFSIPLPMKSPGSPANHPQMNAEDLEEQMADLDVAGIQVQDFGNHLVLTVESGLLFGLGRADLTHEGSAVMASVAEALQKTEGRIRIEGHTCDLQPGTSSDYQNNWWLSTARSVTVLEALQKGGIVPQRMAAAGFGEWDPVAPNDGEPNRQRNRRVEFVIEKERRRADEL